MHQADAIDRRAAARRWRQGADHRISARRRRAPCELRREDRRRCRRGRLDDADDAGPRARPRANSAARQSRSACVSSPAERRSTTASTRFSPPMRGRAHIFNLGHGITPDTPVAHVEQLVGACATRRAPDASGSRRSTSSPSSPGWRRCSICRGSWSITPTRGRLGQVGDFQGDGAAAAARHRQPGDDRDLGFRPLARLADGRSGSALAARKFLFVVLLSAYHGMLVRWVRAFAEDRNTRPARFFRMINEIPALFMVAIVILVVVKPF